jgi:hypothetical protein
MQPPPTGLPTDHDVLKTRPLASIAPITAATVGERSAEVDAATTTTVITTATAAGNFGMSVKPITKSNKPFTSDQLEAPPVPLPTRPGQIGEGNGVTLTRSQRRRALYGLIQLSSCVCKILTPQEGRAFPSTPDTFEPRVCCKSIRNYPNACPEYTRFAQANAWLRGGGTVRRWRGSSGLGQHSRRVVVWVGRGGVRRCAWACGSTGSSTQARGSMGGSARAWGSTGGSARAGSSAVVPHVQSGTNTYSSILY